MQQTESDKLSPEDRKELEANIKELTQKINKADIQRKELRHKTRTQEETDDLELLEEGQMDDVKELRRLRRMRR